MNLNRSTTKYVLFTAAIFMIGLSGFENNTNLRSLMNSWAMEPAESEETHWEKIYGGPVREIGWSVQVTGDGGYIIGGLTRSFGAGETDAYLIKTDLEGNMEWQRTFGSKRRDLSVNVQLTKHSQTT